MLKNTSKYKLIKKIISGKIKNILYFLTKDFKSKSNIKGNSMYNGNLKSKNDLANKSKLKLFINKFNEI